MNRRILGGIFSAATLLGGLAIVTNAPPIAANDKVWICHAVEGEGEFKTGWNLIEVASSAVDGEGQNDHTQHVTKDGRTDIIPAPQRGGVPYCPAPIPLTPVTPEINEPTCTAAGTVIEQTGVIWRITGMTATATAAEGYRIVGQSTFDLSMLDGDDDCPAPPSKVEYGQWVDDQDDCATGEVIQFRKVTTTPYVWNSDPGEWVLDTENATSRFESQRRPMTADELATCRPGVAVVKSPTVTAPTCDAAGFVTLPDPTPGYDWKLQANGTYQAVADEGYEFPPGTVTTFDPGDLTQLPAEQCQASNPPPGTPEQVTPPAATPPPAAAPPPATAVASSGAEQLPTTGGSTGLIAALGLLFVGLGTTALRISRRPIIR